MPDIERQGFFQGIINSFLGKFALGATPIGLGVALYLGFPNSLLAWIGVALCTLGLAYWIYALFGGPTLSRYVPEGMLRFLGALIVSCVIVGLLWPRLATPKTEETLQPVVFSLNCVIDHIPIHIENGATIRVIRMQPGILHSGGPVYGAFNDVSAGDGKDMEWPSKDDGRDMTTKELFGNMSRGMPNPFASKCTAISHGAASLYVSTLTLVISTYGQSATILPSRSRSAIPKCSVSVLFN